MRAFHIQSRRRAWMWACQQLDVANSESDGINRGNNVESGASTDGRRLIDETNGCKAGRRLGGRESVTNLSNCCDMTSDLRTEMTDQPAAESDKTQNTHPPVVGQATPCIYVPDPQI